MNNPADCLNRALQLHKSGKIHEAIELYARLLPEQKNDAQLLDLLGTAYLQTGQRQQGIAHLQRSLAINPENPNALNNLGNALQDFKRMEEALACYDQALALCPNYAEAYYNRGNTLRNLKRAEEALASYDRALALCPDYAQAHNNRGATLQDLKRAEEALASYDRALALRPNHAEAYNNRGTTLRDLNRAEEALASYDRALALRPDYAEAFNNRGTTLRDLQREQEALASYDCALALQPNYAEAYYNRGNALSDLKREEEALASYDRALALRPDYAEAHNNRGATLRDLKRTEEALASYDRALALRPDYTDAHWNKSLLLISTGQYLEGWKLYEWRLEQEKSNYYKFPKLPWRGQEDLRGKRLLIHSEQGFGDVIQFCRYLPLLEALGAETILEVPAVLVPLVSTLNCRTRIITKGSALPDFDAYCPIMSLPYALKTTLDSIPSDIPYLSADPDKVKQWQNRLGQCDRIRIGLAWSGSETHKNDHNRSIQIAQLLALVRLNSVEWHSLQKEYRPPDFEVLKQHPEIRQHQQDLRDFSDTAALIECMDLVISVDTSVAHATGALGKTVWILLPFSPDFRWLIDREDSPWYPSARLYRQPSRDDWQSVIAKIKHDLALFAENTNITTYPCQRSAQ